MVRCACRAERASAFRAFAGFSCFGGLLCTVAAGRAARTLDGSAAGGLATGVSAFGTSVFGTSAAWVAAPAALAVAGPFRRKVRAGEDGDDGGGSGISQANAAGDSDGSPLARFGVARSGADRSGVAAVAAGLSTAGFRRGDGLGRDGSGVAAAAESAVRGKLPGEDEPDAEDGPDAGDETGAAGLGRVADDPPADGVPLAGGAPLADLGRGLSGLAATSALDCGLASLPLAPRACSIPSAGRAGTPSATVMSAGTSRPCSLPFFASLSCLPLPTGLPLLEELPLRGWLAGASSAPRSASRTRPDLAEAGLRGPWRDGAIMSLDRVGWSSAVTSFPPSRFRRHSRRRGPACAHGPVSAPQAVLPLIQTLTRVSLDKSPIRPPMGRRHCFYQSFPHTHGTLPAPDQLTPTRSSDLHADLTGRSATPRPPVGQPRHRCHPRQG